MQLCNTVGSVCLQPSSCLQDPLSPFLANELLPVSAKCVQPMATERLGYLSPKCANGISGVLPSKLVSDFLDRLLFRADNPASNTLQSAVCPNVPRFMPTFLSNSAEGCHASCLSASN